MIENIAFTVKFPPTDHYPLGRDFDRSIDFGPGITQIVGPNEVGKSLILEMIEFLLFGSKALRGRADDYKHLKVSGTVVIRGTRYHIQRTAKNAALSDYVIDETGSSGITLAVGTKPVNARIIQLLGYGLDVFRVANVANQGDAERLSKMLPVERRAMVDRLIGAHEIERIAGWCGEQALGVSREIAGLEQGLICPEEPVEPEGYQPTETLREQRDAARTARERAVELRAFLANEPKVPDLDAPPTDIPLATLEKAEQVLGLRTYDFDLGAVTEQLAGHERWQEKQRFNKQLGPMPVLTQAEIDLQNKRNGLARDRQRLRQSPTILCPCGKPFTTADAEIARLDAEIEAIPQLEGYAQPDLDREEQALRRWTPEAHAKWQALQSAPPIKEPEHDLRDAKGAVHIDEVRDALRVLAIPAQIQDLKSVRELAASLRAWQARAEALDEAMKAHQRWQRQAFPAQTELADLELVAQELPRLEDALAAAQVYERERTRYTELLVEYTKRTSRLTELREEQASWRAGRTALNELREETKNFIVPALSRVASYLLDQMTGGKRSRVAIDEDFEVEVDGQPLATLSGSGKVGTNLAIRLALGRILTNGVFPVFMGDEMDASMDDERAGFLHEAMVEMQKKVSQIIIITHKKPACEQVIQLGE